MDISKEAIEEFKEIYYREFKERISDEEAREMGENLITLFKVICRPIPEDAKIKCAEQKWCSMSARNQAWSCSLRQDYR